VMQGHPINLDPSGAPIDIGPAATAVSPVGGGMFTNPYDQFAFRMGVLEGSLEGIALGLPVFDAAMPGRSYAQSPAYQLGRSGMHADIGWAMAFAPIGGGGRVGGEIGTARGIGATRQVGESYLKTLGGESQVFFRTSQGGRYIDQLVPGAKGAIANESKVGYHWLSSNIGRQVAKDAELIQKGKIDAAIWHFFQSPVTRRIGPSQPLADALRAAGIEIVLH